MYLQAGDGNRPPPHADRGWVPPPPAMVRINGRGWSELEKHTCMSEFSEFVDLGVKSGGGAGAVAAIGVWRAPALSTISVGRASAEA